MRVRLEGCYTRLVQGVSDMWEIRNKRGKYYKRWKPSKAEAFYISVIAFAVIYLIFQVVRG